MQNMTDFPELLKTVPTAFISYSRESEEHKAWVVELGTRLRIDGIDLTLDEWHLRPGDELPRFMEDAIRDSDFVLVVCTPTYRAKSDARSGGVGYEGSVITAEITTGAPRRKFVPILRYGEWREASPSWLKGGVYIDFRSEPYPEEGYSVLRNTLFGLLPEPPPRGPAPPRPSLSSTLRLERERLFADFVNAAQRVSEAIINRRILVKSDNPLARLKLEREVEPEQKKQVQRVMDLLERIKLFASDDTQAAASKIAELAVVWQLTVWHPDGENLFNHQYREFVEVALPAFRMGARKDLDQV
jgi:hypothetical protein